jgi:beta-galactosidase
MTMKKLVLFLAGAALSAQVGAQGDEWRDPQVNQVNRLPMHANFFAYESSAAARGKRQDSERFMTLGGEWKFNWVADSDQRPMDFFRTDFNDKGWGTMPVPGLWELNGYGDPQYLNTGYPWREQFKNDPPNVPVEGNHVGSYRRVIEIPASWDGKQVIAHFGSVTSNMYLWVNGRFAGYSEDSKLEAEFDLTPYLKKGGNLIAFQVFRWCDGTYMEDQDFFRFAGVGRECYLYAREKQHIADLRLDASLTNDHTDGHLEVTASLSPQAKGGTLEVTLADSDGKQVAQRQARIAGADQCLSMDVAKVLAWTTETPNLYTVTATLRNSSGAVVEVIPVKAGFRNVAIQSGLLKVNGKAILVKGANRHEMDPDYGYFVSEERMLQDIKILKQNNFNAVRTCHYPDDNRWYELCDRYGIYLVAEANAESHGMGYGELTLAKNPSYAIAHMERNRRNVQRSINHPSVIVWSLGNEAGNGPNFQACYDWIKQHDPSRPVQYEQARGGADTDINCPMYMSYENCEKYAASNPDKPLIQCEYAHAMGNSMGGFAEYWELIRKYTSYQGGFIWDFVDQSQRKTGKNGVMVYGYGGDWNSYDASDFNFCDNGLIGPDRTLNPHMLEVKYVQQSIWAGDADVKNGKISVHNEYLFRDLSNYYMEWKVSCDGRQVVGGVVSDIAAAPGATATIQLPYARTDMPAGGELLLDVCFKLKSPEPMIPAGYVTAYRQLVIRDHASPELAIAPRTADRNTAPGEVALRENDRNFLIVEGNGVHIDFNRRSGFMTRYEVGPVKYMQEGSSLRPNFWRAPTDNDFGAGLQQKNRVWDNPEMKLVSIEGKMQDGLAVIAANYDMPGIPARLNMLYTINNAGQVLVSQEMIAAADAKVPDMMRFGLRLQMPSRFDRINYYGRGPWENYADRKSSTPIGIYSQSVDEQFNQYIRPQETGTKSDVRWWHQSDLAGHGLKVTSAEPFSASALHYSQESLDEGLVKRQGHSQEVAPQERVFLCIDKAQSGLGCVNSWGALPLPEYRLPYGNYTFEVLISPERVLF